MIALLVDRLVPYLQNLNFSDVVAGIATTLTRDQMNKDNTGTTQVRFPVYYQNQDECGTGDYIDLVPNDKKKSIIYFEDGGSSVTNETYDRFEITHRIKLIFWANLKNINANLVGSPFLAAGIIAAIPKQLTPQDFTSKIFIDYTGQDKKSTAIFSLYSYNEAQKQYLLYPFEYGALNFNVRYSVGKKCVEQLTINPSVC